MVAILSPHAVPEVRMTVDEYFASDLPEGYHYELVDGRIDTTPIPSPLHDTMVAALHEALIYYRTDHHGAGIAHLSQRAAVAIPGKVRVRQPDLAVYRYWVGKGRGWDVWKEFDPLLVCEVIEPEFESRDRIDKRDDYWVAGIEEYWIIDPGTRVLARLSRGPTAWDEENFNRPGQRCATLRLPGFGIAIGDLFGNDNWF